MQWRMNKSVAQKLLTEGDVEHEQGIRVPDVGRASSAEVRHAWYWCWRWCPRPPGSRMKLAQRNRCRKVARGERVTDERGEKRRKEEKGAMMGGRVAKRVKSTP